MSKDRVDVYFDGNGIQVDVNGTAYGYYAGHHLRFFVNTMADFMEAGATIIYHKEGLI